MRARVVVVGAGVAGLAAARTLAAAGAEVVVVERGDLPGGRVRTLRPQGIPVDVGAQFVAPFCERVLAAARDSGLGADLSTAALHGAVVDRRGTHPVSAAGILGSDLMPVGERLRLAALAVPVLRHWGRLDPHDFARARPLDDASVKRLVGTWSGREVGDAVVGPLLRGLLYWDLPTTTQAMFLVMLRVVWRARTVHLLSGGLDRLTDALAAPLDMRLGSEATGLVRVAGGGWRVELAPGAASDGGVAVPDAIDADAVVCATTASVAARLLGAAAPRVAALLRTVTYSRTAVVVCRVPRALAPASTLMFRLGWSDELAAVSVVHGAGVPNHAEGASIVRVFLSDQGAGAVAGHDDAGVAAYALAAARRAGCAWADQATPVDVVRWPEALPRFEVGSLRRRPVPAWAPRDAPGLALAGDYLGGPYLEGAWRSGAAAAGLLLG